MPLDAEEAAEVEAIEAAERAAGEPAETAIRIHRLLRWLPYLLAAALAAVVWQLGSLLGAAVVIAAAFGFAVLRPHLVNGYRYDDEGRLFLDGARTPLDWDQVMSMRVHYWSPPLTADYEHRHVVRRLDVRFVLRNGKTIRFARGEHFHARGPRRPATGGGSGVCVRDGETAAVEVTYAAIPTSGKLWSHGTAPAPVVGFAAEDLAASGMPAPAMSPHTRDAVAFTFDREGNLWIIGGTTVDPTLARYDADTLMAAERTAEIEIVVEGSGCSPGARHLAFDSDGNLWLAVLCDDQVVRLTPDQLATSGTVTADVVLSGVTAPKGLAFDAAGDLWVASETGVAEYAASALGASAAAPTLTIHLVATGDATAADPTALSFDASGNLWATVNANYNFAQIAAADLAGTGEADVEPAVYVSVGVSALPAGTAIDDAGALWFGETAGVLGRLDPDQLTTSTTYAAPTTAAARIESDAVASSASVAFYPAAAGLPLFHSLP